MLERKCFKLQASSLNSFHLPVTFVRKGASGGPAGERAVLKGGERAAPSDIPRHSSIIMVPSITQLLLVFFHTDISIKISQNKVPAMF